MSEPLPPEPAAEPQVEEPRSERLRRQAHHVQLYSSAALLVVALVVIVALVIANTRQVRINWVFGHSNASLVWIVLVAAIFGWIAGIATSLVFRHRVRPPRR